MKRRLLAICSSVVLVTSGLVGSVSVATVTAPTALAGAGSYNCFGVHNGTFAYEIIDRNTAQTGGTAYSKVKTDFIYGELKHCANPGSLQFGQPMFWLSAQDFEGGSSRIIQVGYMDCGRPGGCPFTSGTIAYGSSAFVYSKSGNQSGGDLNYWTGNPQEVFGHEYRAYIAANGANWNICLQDLTIGGGLYCKAIAKTWDIDYMWIGCEADQAETYCGSDTDSSIQLSTNQMQYTRADNGIVYTINNGGGGSVVCELPTSGSYTPTRECASLNGEDSSWRFETND